MDSANCEEELQFKPSPRLVLSPVTQLLCFKVNMEATGERPRWHRPVISGLELLMQEGSLGCLIRSSVNNQKQF